MEASMSSIRFDKLKFVKILEKEGNQSPESAEAFAKAIEEALTESQSSLATKSDLQIEMTKLKSELISEIHSVIYKMAGIIIAGVGVLMGLMKFIH
ncbi:hypothetical protein IO49_06505 [Gallibacterium anatis]|nr:hypothetical protein IO49_06505 [Gallibacterium anatis]